MTAARTRRHLLPQTGLTMKLAATLLAVLIAATGCNLDPVMGRDATYTPPSTTTLVPPERR